MAEFDPAIFNSWFASGHDPGSVQLVDPQTCQPFEPVPKCILAEPVLARGYDFLRNRSDRISITLMGVVHDRASSLGPMPDGWTLNTFEDFVQSCDYFGYEAFGWHSKRIAMRKSIAHSALALTGFDNWRLFADTYVHQSREQGVDNDKNAEYTARIMRSAAGYSDVTPSFPADIRSDGTPFEKSVLEAARTSALLPAKVGAAVFIACNNLREYAIVARTGLALQQHERSRTPRPLHVGLVFGRGHRPLKDKFGALGVSVDIVQPPDVALPKLSYGLEGVYQNGIITQEDVAAFLGANKAMASIATQALKQ